MRRDTRSVLRRAGFGGCLCVLSWLAASACSGDASDPAGSGTTDGNLDGSNLEGIVSCARDPRVDAYQDLSKTGELGVLSFRLVQAEPAPPAKGNNTFRLEITDAQGAPISGDLKVDLKMPDHGHGTSVKPQCSFDTATGEWTVDPLYLFMPGVWRVQLEAFSGAAAAGATALDRTTLFFCIEG